MTEGKNISVSPVADLLCRLMLLVLVALLAVPPLQGKTRSPESRTAACTRYNDLYDEIWQLVNDHFLYRERLSRWQAWRHKFDDKMKSEKQAEAAINSMVDSLADEYTYFRNRESTKHRKEIDEQRSVAQYRILNGSIGYLKITTFNSRHCVPETRKALSSMKGVQGYILDLRDNWGGCIDTAFSVFSMMAYSGTFVTMEGTADSSDYHECMSLQRDRAVVVVDGMETRSTRELNLTGAKPMVILVNRNTKSAAEMLAGALRDSRNARVIGETTYGKAIVQRIWAFPNNTSIKISSAFFYLPSGELIHKKGLKPDLLLAERHDRKFKAPCQQCWPDRAGSANDFLRLKHDRQLARAHRLFSRKRISMVARP